MSQGSNGILQDTISLIDRVHRKTLSLETFIRDGTRNSPDVKRAKKALQNMRTQLEILQENKKKQEGPPAVAAPEEAHHPSEKVISTLKYLKTKIDVLYESEEIMNVRFRYKDHSATAIVTATQDQGPCLSNPHTLPLFIPTLMDKYQFDNFHDLLAAVANIFQAYLMRKHYVQLVQDQYGDRLLQGRVERDYTCCTLKFTVPVTMEGATGYLQFKILYPMDNIKAENVFLHLIGSQEFVDSCGTELSEKSSAFREHHFLSAFELVFS